MALSTEWVALKTGQSGSGGVEYSLSKKHTDKRARRKKDSVPSVSQMQNHMNTGT